MNKIQVISYSAVIRTLGNTGEKYVRTIRSILNLTIPPEEIIVVIPYGYELDYHCGIERVVCCEKGMVTQRAVGIDEANADYILVLDDDVELATDFVEQCFSWLDRWNLDCVLPQKPDSPIIFRFKDKLKGLIRGTLYTSTSQSEWQDVILYTSGHMVFVNSFKVDECYYCQTGCFQVFFMKTSSAKNVRLIDETWLEQGSISRYAILDDAVFFYKSHLLGQKTACAPANYIHLDAAAGRPARSKVEERRIRYYSEMRNHYIFWYKIIYKQSRTLCQKLLSRLGWVHFLIGYSLWSVLACMRPKYWSAISALFIGYSDASKYIKSSL